MSPRTLNKTRLDTSHLAHLYWALVFVWLERQRPSLKEWQNNYWGHVFLSVKVGHLFYWSASEGMVNITTAQDTTLTVGNKNILRNIWYRVDVCFSNFSEWCKWGSYCCGWRSLSDRLVLPPVTFTCLFQNYHSDIPSGVKFLFSTHN